MPVGVRRVEVETESQSVLVLIFVLAPTNWHCLIIGFYKECIMRCTTNLTGTVFQDHKWPGQFIRVVLIHFVYRDQTSLVHDRYQVLLEGCLRELQPRIQKAAKIQQ